MYKYEKIIKNERGTTWSKVRIALYVICHELSESLSFVECNDKAGRIRIRVICFQNNDRLESR